MGIRSSRTLAVPSLPLGEKIPQIVHQTFRTRQLKPELAASVDEMRRRNPDWDYRFYDDNDLKDYVLKHYGPDFLAYFDAINDHYAPAKADLFRYLLMYREGGLYLDIKSQATRPLNQVLRPTDRYLISQWRNGPDSRFPTWGLHSELRKIPGGEYQQWFILAAPGHPFLKVVIEQVMRNLRRYNPVHYGVGKQAVLRTTGPIAYTLAIAPIRAQCPHRMVDSIADLGFRYSIYADDDHQAALGDHYSNLDEALIGKHPLTSVAISVRRTAEAARHSLSRGRRLLMRPA